MSGAEADWPPLYRALWEHCAANPEAVEDHPWGDTVFKIRGKVFAFLGGPESVGVTVKVPPDELDTLLEASFIKRAKYVGRYGWLSVRIEDDDALKLALDLVDDSFEIVGARGARRSRS